MRREFDVTVRMQSDEDLAAFRLAMSKFPGYEIVDVRERRTDLDVKPIAELSWQEELEDLRVSLGEVKEALKNGDENTMNAFVRINLKAGRVPQDDFVLRAVALFDATVAAYAGCEERPGKKRDGRVFDYTKLPGTLTPRYFRLAMGLFQLDGKYRSPADVMRREGQEPRDAANFNYQVQFTITRLLYLRKQ